MAPRGSSEDPKVTALRESRCLNPHPEQVTDPAFLAREFFDARDSRSAVTFGSPDDPRGAMPPPSRYDRQDNSADPERGFHHDTPQKLRNNQENNRIPARSPVL